MIRSCILPPSLLRALLCSALCCCLSPSATLRGQVRDEGGSLIPGATVEIKAVDDPITVLSDQEGLYRFESIPGGTYRLHAQSAGQNLQAEVDEIQLDPNGTKTVNLTLKPSASSTAKAPEFFDQPSFTIAGVADNTYLGGHGSDAVARSKEDLARAAQGLNPDGRAAVHLSLSSLSALLEKQPTNADLHARMAVAYENSDRPLDALREFQHAAELDGSESHFFDWGTELLVHAAPAQAAEIFSRGHARFPRSTRMLLGDAAALYAQGNYAAAANCFFQAADLNPRDPVPYLFLAKVQAPDITRSQAFLDRMKRFAAFCPANPEAHYNFALALTRFSLNSLTAMQIRSSLEKALSLNPNFAPAYLQLGILYLQRNSLSGAISNLQTAIRLDPQLEEAHYRLAAAYRQSGASEKAADEAKIFSQLSQMSAERATRERAELQKFVGGMKSPPVP